MELEQLEAKIKELDRDHKKAVNEAIVGYCFANNTVKIGDIFTDHIGSIVVEDIKASSFFKMYGCVYFGLELTKKLEPKKNGSKRSAFQQNAAT